MSENKRETFGTRPGFIPVSAGCSIGVVNVLASLPCVFGYNIRSGLL